MHGRVRVLVWLYVHAKKAVGPRVAHQINSAFATVYKEYHSKTKTTFESSLICITLVEAFLHESLDDLVAALWRDGRPMERLWAGMFKAVGRLLQISLSDKVENKLEQEFYETCQVVLQLCHNEHIPLWPWVHFFLVHYHHVVRCYRSFELFSLKGLEHFHKRAGRYQVRTMHGMKRASGVVSWGEVLEKDNQDMYLVIHGRDRPHVEL